MRRRILCLTLLVCLLAGCAPREPEQKLYNATFLTLFDTVTTIRGYGQSEETFLQTAQAIHDDLEYYHRLFDIYNDYEGVNNLKTVNDHGWEAPVPVEGAILDLLEDCKEYYTLTQGRVNVAMGSVLQLWHEARSDGLDDPGNAYLPQDAALTAAAEHMDLDTLVLDRENSTVFLSDPQVRLDVGAVAKGWAAQRAAENAPKGLLISVGGNVVATGPKEENGTPWRVGVQDPDGGDYLHTLNITGGSVVTSGDYQRCYLVDGKIYHHIIDPDTRYPGTLWRAVTVLCDDSGLADALSTALFLLPLEDGMALAERCGTKAMWVDGDGKLYYSPGFEELIRT